MAARRQNPATRPRREHRCAQLESYGRPLSCQVSGAARPGGRHAARGIVDRMDMMDRVDESRQSVRFTMSTRFTRPRPTSSSLPLEPLEFDAVRFDCGVAQTALLVGLVVLEIAL